MTNDAVGRSSPGGADATENGAARESVPGSPAIDLLLIENDEGDAALLRGMLRGSGLNCSLEQTNHVGDALTRIAAASPDCILLDLDRTGSDAVAEIAALRAGARNVPIIVMTGIEDKDIGIRAVQLGAQDYLPKESLNPSLLARTIRYALERKRLEAELAHSASHDSLTGLPNRLLFIERLGQAVARWDRHGSRVAVMYLDLDRFKAVNDLVGQSGGDALLVAVSERLRTTLRPTDVIARFGSDEFTILCEDLLDEQDVATITNRVEQSIREPFVINDKEVFVTTSVGIAMASQSSPSAEELMRDADTAMYRAKEKGKNRIEIFDEDMRIRIEARYETENSLRRAIERDEFCLYYQPLVDVRTEEIIGVEALVRWNHPEKGLLPPGDFIPLAEETGMIIPLGTWVLQEACRVMKRLQDEFAVRSDMRMSVNLSAAQFAAQDLLEIVAEALEATGLNPANLCLEITESILMEVEVATRSLLALRGLGVSLSIDDFGTGYSSLAYLKRFPVHTLKVDRSFVDGLGQDEDDSAIVSAVISMARALGLATVAEGVETGEQLNELRGLQSDFAQGFFFAKPLPLDELIGRLQQPLGDDLLPGLALVGSLPPAIPVPGAE